MLFEDFNKEKFDGVACALYLFWSGTRWPQWVGIWSSNVNISPSSWSPRSNIFFLDSFPLWKTGPPPLKLPFLFLTLSSDTSTEFMAKLIYDQLSSNIKAHTNSWWLTCHLGFLKIFIRYRHINKFYIFFLRLVNCLFNFLLK